MTTNLIIKSHDGVKDILKLNLLKNKRKKIVFQLLFGLVSIIKMD